MSVRAYRIIEIKMEDTPSFNLWRDEDLRQFLEEEADLYCHLDADGGMVDVPVKVLKIALKKAVELNLDEITINQLEKDIAAAKSAKDESVSYLCC